jgi:hypothetical protein
MEWIKVYLKANAKLLGTRVGGGPGARGIRIPLRRGNSPTVTREVAQEGELVGLAEEKLRSSWPLTSWTPSEQRDEKALVLGSLREHTPAQAAMKPRRMGEVQLRLSQTEGGIKDPV